MQAHTSRTRSSHEPEDEDDDLYIVYEDEPKFDPYNYKNKRFCVGDTIIEPLPDNVSASAHYYKDTRTSKTSATVTLSDDKDDIEDEYASDDDDNNDNAESSYSYHNPNFPSTSKHKYQYQPYNSSINEIPLKQPRTSANFPTSYNISESSDGSIENSDESEIKIINTFTLSDRIPEKPIITTKKQPKFRLQKQITPSYLDVLTTVDPTNTWW